MKLHFLWMLTIGSLLLGTPVIGAQHYTYGSMKNWKMHYAFGYNSHVAASSQRIYALSDGAMFSVDKTTKSINTHSKVSGLNGSSIAAIAYANDEEALLIAYRDGLIDLLTDDDEVTSIQDLALKQASYDKQANSINIDNNMAYMSMPFGILVLNLANREVKDTYFIGPDGSEVNILETTLLGDSLYAISADELLAGHIQNNLLDYAVWRRYSVELPGDSALSHLVSYNNQLYLIRGQRLYRRPANGQWQSCFADLSLIGMKVQAHRLLLFGADSTTYMVDNDDNISPLCWGYSVTDAVYTSGQWWLAANEGGLINLTSESTDQYYPNGPAVNMPYRMTLANSTLYMVPGARWATQSNRGGTIMQYQDGTWHNIYYSEIASQAGIDPLDFMNVAVDPLDPEHFFVTSYGTGLYEFNGSTLVKNYMHYNSPLTTLAPGPYENMYVRTDAGMYDTDGNYWFINTQAESQTIHIVRPSDLQRAHVQDSSGWFTMNLYDAQGKRIIINTPQEMFIDQQNEHYKWIPSARVEPGMILLDDKGTPFNPGDDRALMRTSFIDQNNKVVSPAAIYCAKQDKSGNIWVGTNAGVFILDASNDFFTSNKCRRVVINRDDGTDLADYLLNTEQVNAIAIDGSDRKWFGTAASGLYLMSEDGVETLEHFTTDNSPLISNEILSLAINPKTGEVFVGTAAGLMSYQSDAAEPEDSFDHVYAYPNPVRPEFQGYITITGLMDNSVLYILDPGGNLVLKTYSNGGVATWDGKNANGKRVASGVYTVLCHTRDGNSHELVKILIMH